VAIPTPEPGLVVSYSYLWNREAQDGQEEGRKDRPCVIALAVQRRQDGETWVTVLPVTHSPPQEVAAAVEIPSAVKRHLGLDDARSWVVVSEGDQFVWPGYDLRKTPGGERYDYGFLPPRFFASILAAFRAWHTAHKVMLTTR
jgi:hypothetical protein